MTQKTIFNITEAARLIGVTAQPNRVGKSEENKPRFTHAGGNTTIIPRKNQPGFRAGTG
jgi:hypothetical protein